MAQDGVLWSGREIYSWLLLDQGWSIHTVILNHMDAFPFRFKYWAQAVLLFFVTHPTIKYNIS